MSDSPFRPLENEADWSDAVEQSKEDAVVVFKHSTACPISADANEEMKGLAEEYPVSIYRVVVQENRPVSNHIAETLNITHETPQAILLRDGQSVFDTSHLNVTADTLQKELNRSPA